MFGKSKMNTNRSRVSAGSQPANATPATPAQPANATPAPPAANPTPPQPAGNRWIQTISENKKGLALVGVIIVSGYLIAKGGQLYGADQQTMVKFALGLLIDVALIGVTVGASFDKALKWLIPVFVAVVLLVVIGMSPKDIVEATKTQGSKAVSAVTAVTASPEWEADEKLVIKTEPGVKVSTGIMINPGDRIHFFHGDNTPKFKFSDGKGGMILIDREFDGTVNSAGQIMLFGEETGLVLLQVYRKK